MLDTPPPQITTEEALIRAILNDASGEKVRQCRGWAGANVLTQERLALLLGELEEAVADGRGIGSLPLHILAEKTGMELPHLKRLQDSFCSADERDFVSNRKFIHNAFLNRCLRSTIAELGNDAEPEQLERAATRLGRIAHAARGGEAMAGDRFSHLRFDPSRVLGKPKVVVTIKGVDVCTTGNISMITAEKKAGKTALTGGILAAMMKSPGTDSSDTFGISAENPDGLGVLHLDTEQSQYDHHRFISTAMQRAGVGSLPAWVYSYGLLGECIPDILGHLEERLFSMREEHRGIKLVLLDGVGDLVLDANDAKESALLVARLQRLAVRYDCAIICVLHLNPNSKRGREKSRGHLGSILERKAEVDIRVVKDSNQISTIFTACSRREPIPEAEGPQFRWSHEKGLHVSFEGRASQEQKKLDELTALAAEVFDTCTPKRYTQVRDEIARIKKIVPKSAERWVMLLTNMRLITQTEAGLWALAPSTPNPTSNYPQ